MSERKVLYLMIGATVFSLLLLGISVRGPEATLDWVLSRVDLFLNWMFNK